MLPGDKEKRSYTGVANMKTIYRENKSDKNNPNELKEYSCGYCRNVFRMWVNRWERTGQQEKAGSSMVKCPNCKNKLKTASGVTI